MGHFNGLMVLASYGVAVLAAYSALYFGAQLTTVSGIRGRLWLGLGGLTMGTGVWTMHFVGMQAHGMSATLSYDLLLTAISWLAAVLASALALFMISLPKVQVRHIALASVLMGGGIVVMHYVGMAAMKMAPAPSYNPSLLILSVVIALAASAVAMVLCRRLQQAPGRRAWILQLASALVMGGAIAGMHYTGMMAVVLPEDGVPAAGNQLAGNWLGLPLALIMSVMVALAVMASIMDVRVRMAQVVAAERERIRLERLAFVDESTNLPNRAAAEKHILELIVQEEAVDRRFAVIYLAISNFSELRSVLGADPLERAMAAVTEDLRLILNSGCFMARYAQDAFMVVVEEHENARHSAMFRRLQKLEGQLSVQGMALGWVAGQSVFPDTGRSSRMLVRVAMKTGSVAELGKFGTIHPAYTRPMSAPLAAGG